MMAALKVGIGERWIILFCYSLLFDDQQGEVVLEVD